MKDSGIRHCTAEECPKYVAGRLGVAIITCSFLKPENLPYGIECIYCLPAEEVRGDNDKSRLVGSVS